MKMHKGGKPMAPSKMIGIVLAIRELPKEMKNSRNGNWANVLGHNTVDVLWQSGKVSKNFAENSLEVVSENHAEFFHELGAAL